MLYEAIRESCKIYHWYYAKYDIAYNEAVRDNPKTLKGEALEMEISKIVAFLKVWNPRRPMDPRALASKLPQVSADLNGLSSYTILDVKCTEKTTELISGSFGSLANCGRKHEGKSQYEPVNASKILHLINPELFVMWDNPIMDWYKRRGWYKLAYYVKDSNSFLPRIQGLAKDAISQAERQGKVSSDEALRSFTDYCIHKNSLAKIIDEYDFVISRFKPRTILINRLAKEHNVSSTEIWRKLAGGCQ